MLDVLCNCRTKSTDIHKTVCTYFQVGNIVSVDLEHHVHVLTTIFKGTYTTGEKSKSGIQLYKTICTFIQNHVHIYIKKTC